MRYNLILLAVVASAGTAAHGAFVVNSYSAAGWGGSDASIGVSGYTIDDLEDVNLVSGLQIGVISPNGNLAPTSTLPNTFKPSDDAYGSAFTLGGGGAWDGEHGVINTRTNQTFNYAEPGSWGNLTFYFGPSVTSAGFSVQQMDRDATIMVNGASIGNVSVLAPNFSSGNGRQGYLRVDATGGDTISSLGIQDAFGGGDGYMFDHVAFQSVPEPISLVALCGGLGLLARRRRVS